MPRYDRLPGIGRVRVYDHGSQGDRYTVLFEDFDVYEGISTTPHKPRPYGIRAALGMDRYPDSPYGISQSCDAYPGPHLGRRIPFSSLPENVQRHVIARATED